MNKLLRIILNKVNNSFRFESSQIVGFNNKKLYIHKTRKKDSVDYYDRIGYIVDFSSMSLYVIPIHFDGTIYGNGWTYSFNHYLNLFDYQTKTSKDQLKSYSKNWNDNVPNEYKIIQ